MPSRLAAPELRFGDMLRRLRVERGLTQELLAERTGLSVRGISDLERGARNLPRQETILRLIDGLELPANEQALLLAASQRTPRPRALPLDTTRPLFSGNPGSQPDAFIGREAELSAILLALHDPSHRLLTLTGPPGVGKTRLAIEAARRLDALVETEIVVVDLAPIRNPALVLPAIAAAVGLPESGPALLDRLRASLAARPILLVLDNFEHLLAAAPVVSELLQSCSSELRSLVTSREPLRIAGEHELPVSPLTTPKLASEMRVRDVVAHEAVAFFVVRARESDRAFRLSDDNARAIAELCIRLDGLPLALELAAARVTHLSPAAMVERLAQRRPVLTAGRRDLPERQRTLADAIDWSYDLLRPDEQRLFRLCSVFLGGFTLDAAEALGQTASRPAEPDPDAPCSSITQHPTPITLLESLADKSLLVRQPGQSRYTMLETVREYGLERLVAHGEEAAVRRAHAAHFLALAETAARAFVMGTGQHAAMERLADEHDNLRQALAWAEEQADSAPLLRLTQALWRFWWIQGHPSEGQRWLQRALERSQDGPAAERASILIAAGRLAWLRRDLALAARWLETALSLDPAPFDRCEALNTLSDVAHFQHAYGRAAAVLTEAIALARAHEDWFHLSASLHNLGIVALEQGDHARARTALDESVAWARRAGHDYLVSSALHHLGRTAFEEGNYAQAATLWQETLALQRELAPTYPIGSVAVLEGVALLAIVRDRHALGARCFGAMTTQRSRVEDRENADRQRYLAPWIATAREAVGDARFAREWDEGCSLSIDAALAEAAAALEEWSRSGSETVRS